ncbi:MAG: ABC transporter ATP-binding protein [Anaerolineae bacterium]|nr:ABC transporter ATP-binding protein [Anaerolineae bacterium]
MIIETKGLTKYYGKVRGIEDLDLSVREGEVFGYLGPNGAGKTTTIRLILDLIRPTRGTALLFGQEVQGRAAELKAQLGILPGELALWGNLTARDLLTFLGNLRGGLDWAWVDELAQRLDLDLSRRVGTFSHGNKQKVGLIQAFAHKPDLLILDEPTTGLDPLIQQEFYRLIDEVRAEGRTVFLSSHILPEVDRVCDRVGIIREGHLVTVEEIAELKRKRLRQMELTFSQPVSPSALNLPGVRDVVQTGNSLRFFVDEAPGSLDGVVKRAAQFELIDMRYEQATLEDIFLAYYRKQATDKEGGDVAA